MKRIHRTVGEIISGIGVGGGLVGGTEGAREANMGVSGVSGEFSKKLLSVFGDLGPEEPGIAAAEGSP